jgi:MoaA/NifB/PqqE/SkfB family radical SAM enzyme
MGPTGDCIRVLQVHPTRRCNLSCLHCYSSSGPQERDEIPVPLLLDALHDASEEGYNVAGFSGGEPILYRPLRQALEQARSCGMFTTVTSNGMLLDERRLEMLSGAVDLLAISLDGFPESHNRLRGSSRAFETMESRLEGVRRSGVPFGFIFTLTQHNVHELEWVADFAVRQEARLLQIHPLEEVGRAARKLAGSRPDDVESAFAFLEVARIQERMGERLRIQLDLTDRELLRAEPGRAFADEISPDAATQPLSRLVSPLVLESDGTVVPIQHGFDRRYALGNIHEAPLCRIAAEWKRARMPEFHTLCRRVFEGLTAPADLPFVNWYETFHLASPDPGGSHVRASGDPRRESLVAEPQPVDGAGR